MLLKVFKNTVLLFVIAAICCKNKAYTDTEGCISKNTTNTMCTAYQTNNISVGANQLGHYLGLLKDKRIGIVANQTSVIFHHTNTQKSYTHIVDSLLTLGIDIKNVFAPEHGFRGNIDAGEAVKDGIDTKTGLPVVSLYGKAKKPSADQLQNLDVIVFDIQDVGVRFYTYISSLHYVMEACAEQSIPLIVLDRPNPNGHYIDGPTLELAHKSFVGMHPVPVVHGMTIGEYAQMINGEAWLKNNIQCNLTVIPVKNYTHQTKYNLSIKPSPNLPNDKAINLYPSLCFFEGTNVSIGRGTDTPFQIIGSPFVNPKKFNFQFTPQPNEGAKHPKHQDFICYGYNIPPSTKLNALVLDWLIAFYNANKNHSPQEPFFNSFFTKLAGTEHLQQYIEAGMPADSIRKRWKTGLDHFKTIRKKYLLYN